MDSSKIPKPPNIVPITIYFPPTMRCGSNTKANMKTVTGMKLVMKRVEIMTTILDTFTLRRDNSADKETDDFNQPDLLCRLMTNITVVTIIIRKAINGSKKLLTINEIFSTLFLSDVDTRPIRVLFLEG